MWTEKVIASLYLDETVNFWTDKKKLILMKRIDKAGPREVGRA